jgi:CheY-like chemotaxis protein
MDRIFEPFFTTKERGKGTGMGLSAVYGSVSQGKGHIAVESALGAGTSFYIYLPAVDLIPERIHVDSKEIEPVAVLRSKETILLVEDNLEVRFLLSTILKDQGYTVQEAEDGCAALEIFNDEIDLVVSDVVMPRLDGYELSKKLQAKYPELKVLLISGHTDQLVTLKDLNIHNLRLLSKPFPTHKLIQEVRLFLDYCG